MAKSLKITIKGPPGLVRSLFANAFKLDSPASAPIPFGLPPLEWIEFLVNFQRKHKPGNPAANPPPPPDGGDRALDLSIFPNVERGDLDALKSWLDAAMHRRKPYGLLVIYGPAASGKSVMSRVLKDFIEGSGLRVTVYDNAPELTEKQSGEIAVALGEIPVIVNSGDPQPILLEDQGARKLYTGQPAPTVITLIRTLEESERKPGVETIGFRS